MKKLLISYIVGLSLLICGTALAELLPEFPSNTYVVDTTGSLSKESITNINTKLLALDKSGKAVMGVVLLQTAATASVNELGVLIGEKWNLGHKDKDDGIILSIYLLDHKSNLTTGRGISGDITDAVSKEILSNSSKFFKKKEYESGILSTIAQVDAAILPVSKVPEEMNREYKIGIVDKIMITLIAISLILFLIWLYFDKVHREEEAAAAMERLAVLRLRQDLARSRQTQRNPSSVNLSKTQAYTPKPKPEPSNISTVLDDSLDVLEAAAIGAFVGELLSKSSDSISDVFSSSRDSSSSSFDGGGASDDW